MTNNNICVYLIPHYIQRDKRYTNILIIEPALNHLDPLGKITRRIRQEKLSPYKSNTNECCNQCITAVMSDETKHDFWCANRIPEFICELIGYGYVVDSDLTKLLLKTKTTSHQNSRRLIVIANRSVP